MTREPAVVSSIVVVGAQTRYALLHSVWDLKAAQINVQCWLIQELLLYEFEVSHNADEAIKNICYVNGEGAVDHMIRWFKKYFSGYKNIDGQVGLKPWIQGLAQSNRGKCGM